MKNEFLINETIEESKKKNFTFINYIKILKKCKKFLFYFISMFFLISLGLFNFIILELFLK